MDRYQQIHQLLLSLEQVMREQSLWQTTPPSAQALASTEPFAVDTLSCGEWLQWIFIPKLGQLVTLKMPLPQQFEISPYVEEAMKEQTGGAAVLAITQQLDALFK